MTLKQQLFHFSSPPSYCKKRNNNNNNKKKKQQESNNNNKIYIPNYHHHNKNFTVKLSDITSGHKKSLFYLFMLLDLDISFLPPNILKNNSNFSYIASR